MDRQEFERAALMIMLAGVIVAVVEFIAVAFVLNKPTIIGFQNALLSAGGVMVVVVVVLWVASALLKPKDDDQAETNSVDDSSESIVMGDT